MEKQIQDSKCLFLNSRLVCSRNNFRNSTIYANKHVYKLVKSKQTDYVELREWFNGQKKYMIRRFFFLPVGWGVGWGVGLGVGGLTSAALPSPFPVISSRKQGLTCTQFYEGKKWREVDENCTLRRGIDKTS